MCYFIVVSAPEEFGRDLRLSLGGYRCELIDRPTWPEKVAYWVTDRGWCGCNLYCRPPEPRVDRWERYQRKLSKPKSRKKGLKPPMTLPDPHPALPQSSPGISVPLMLALQCFGPVGLMVQWEQHWPQPDCETELTTYEHLLDDPALVDRDVLYLVS